MTTTPAASPARAGQRISGPGELLQAVPYLLGFHPHDSLVVVGLRGGILVVTARLDLADVFAPNGLLEQTLAHVSDGGADQIVAAMYTSASVADDAARERAERIVAAAESAGCRTGDVLLVGKSRYWSLRCVEPACCDPAGRSRDDLQSPFAAAATVDGLVPLPDRAALVALLAPDPDASALQPLLDEAPADPPGAARRRVTAAARAATNPDWTPPDDARLARLAVSLRVLAVRDAVWLDVDERRLDGRPLWRVLATRMPAPYDSAAALLFGWASWRAGDGALARIAAERAVASDPGNTAADLLLAALSRGVDPYAFPPLRDGAR